MHRCLSQARLAEERQRAAQSACESLRSELAEVRRSLEALRGKGGGASAEQLRQLQDMCVEAQERSGMMEFTIQSQGLRIMDQMGHENRF